MSYVSLGYRERVLDRPMSPWGEPEWPGALWIGECDRADVDGTGSLPLDGADGYHSARLLVRDGRTLLGFVTVPVTKGSVSRAAVVEAVAVLPERAPESDPPTPPISVVMCTRDRAALFADALASVLETDYPTFEVIVVDNAGITAETREFAANHPDDRVRYVSEPRPGVSRGRNRGLRAAAYDIVAFVDDDVIVDRHWLTGLATGFARADDVALVCALVASGEVRTRPQAWFDNRVSWDDARSPRQFRLADPPSDVPLFPFQVGAYGTGACFAVKRGVYEKVGALDVAMGPGTPTMGGEDIDLFVRIVCADWAVAVEPAAVVWHRHRAEISALKTQARGYGIGLGAWLTKTALNPRLMRLALPLLPAAVARIRTLATGGSADPEQVDREFGLPHGYTRQLGHLEVRWALAGPVRYARAVVDALRP
jgi:GT2 family glycosyltransferase